MEGVLTACVKAGEPAPCSDPMASRPVATELLAGLFDTVGTYQRDPPEVRADAQPGEPGYCAAFSPASPNRLCALRRAIDRLIQQRDPDGRIVMVGAAEQALPILADILRYANGTHPQLPGEHYETLPVLRQIVRACGDAEFKALGHGLIDALRPPAGLRLLDAATKVLRNPDGQRFLSGLDVNGDVGRTGFATLIGLLAQRIRQPSFTPADLDQVLDDLVYPFIAQAFPDNGLEADLRGLMGEVKLLLDPARDPQVLRPLQSVMGCALDRDPDNILLGSAYDLLFVGQTVALDDLPELARALIALDDDGSLLATADILWGDLMSNQRITEGVADLAYQLFTEENARALNPVLILILDSEIPAEMIGMADMLLSGCGGGGVQ